jgi:hypothetical protein
MHEKMSAIKGMFPHFCHDLDLLSELLLPTFPALALGTVFAPVGTPMADTFGRKNKTSSIFLKPII